MSCDPIRLLPVYAKSISLCSEILNGGTVLEEGTPRERSERHSLSFYLDTVVVVRHNSN